MIKPFATKTEISEEVLNFFFSAGYFRLNP
jgi:hypothetical protein